MNRVEEEWIPPPDSPPPPHTSDELKLIQPGRLHVKCIRGESIRRKDDRNEKTSLNPSIRLTLAPGCSHPLQQTSTPQQGTNENPDFQNEVLHFDVQNPHDYVTNSNDVRLRVELLDKPQLQHEILGQVEISILRFLASKTSNFTVSHHTERLPLLQPGDSSSNSFIMLEFSFIPVHEGILHITLLECKNLQNFESKEAPNEIMCTIQMDDASSKKGSLPVMEKTSNPKFTPHGEEIFLEVNKDNWFNELDITVSGNVTTGPKILIGQGTLPVLPVMGKFSKWNFLGDETGELPPGEKKLIPLKRVEDGKKVMVGAAMASFKFLLAGHLTATNIHSNLDNPVISKSSSLQLHFKAKGRASTLIRKSSSMKISPDDNISISWKDELVELPLVDHHFLQIESYTFDAMGSNQELVGTAQLSILPVFSQGHMQVTATLKAPNEVGSTMDVGQVSFDLKFEGNGMSYPKLHPSATAVDKTNTGISGNVSTQKKPIAQEIVKKGKDVAASVTEVFSDEDIKLSFKFFDLDKNGYIGAAELKHVLICMGELVTDDEVDAMIDILDKNGDGQVGFDEFTMMGKSSNFGYESMSNHNVISNKQMNQALDQNYDIKRMVFSHFVVNNKIHRGVINTCRDFLNQKRYAALSDVNMSTASGEEADFSPTHSIWKLDYASMCRIMSIEPTGESRRVFDLLLESDEKQKVDARHLILGLVNFIPTFSVHERCQMMLEMYDVKRSETLNFDNLLDILASNHLKSRDSVSRKAKTVMKFVDQAGTGKLMLDDLLDAATKFPNLLLPKHIGVEAK